MVCISSGDHFKRITYYAISKKKSYLIYFQSSIRLFFFFCLLWSVKFIKKKKRKNSYDKWNTIFAINWIFLLYISGHRYVCLPDNNRVALVLFILPMHWCLIQTRKTSKIFWWCRNSSIWYNKPNLESFRFTVHK